MYLPQAINMEIHHVFTDNDTKYELRDLLHINPMSDTLVKTQKSSNW